VWPVPNWEFLKKFNCPGPGDHQESSDQVANLYPDRRASNSLHTERFVSHFERSADQISENSNSDIQSGKAWLQTSLSPAGKRITPAYLADPDVLKIRVPLEVCTEHAHRLLGKTVTRIEWRSRDLSEEKYGRHHSGRQQKKSRNRAMGDVVRS
jgi:hypothetical protein